MIWPLGGRGKIKGKGQKSGAGEFHGKREGARVAHSVGGGETLGKKK